MTLREQFEKETGRGAKWEDYGDYAESGTYSFDDSYVLWLESLVERQRGEIEEIGKRKAVKAISLAIADAEISELKIALSTARSEERERCAKVVERTAEIAFLTREAVATAIRNLKEEGK